MNGDKPYKDGNSMCLLWERESCTCSQLKTRQQPCVYVSAHLRPFHVLHGHNPKQPIPVDKPSTPPLRRQLFLTAINDNDR